MSDRKNKLEMYVAAMLEPIYKYSRPTIASGATPVEKGDIKNPYFLIECKDWNTKSFSIKDDVWQIVKVQAARDYKDPVYVVENETGNRLAIMDLNDWFNMVYELIELRDMMENIQMGGKEPVPNCFYCGSAKTLKFPCCGYFCMACGKTFEDADIEECKNAEKELQQEKK